jgi:hypothetical protein
MAIRCAGLHQVNKAALAGERILPPPWAPRELVAAFDTLLSQCLLLFRNY